MRYLVAAEPNEVCSRRRERRKPALGRAVARGKYVLFESNASTVTGLTDVSVARSDGTGQPTTLVTAASLRGTRTRSYAVVLASTEADAATGYTVLTALV